MECSSSSAVPSHTGLERHGPGFASLGLKHLSRSQLSLLLAALSINTRGDREVLVERLSQHLRNTLPWEWRVTRLNPLSSVDGPQREYAGIALWQDQIYLVGGGYASLTPEPELLWKYDLLRSEWTLLRDSPRSPCVRSGHSVVVFDNKLWLFGGYSDTLVQYFRDMYTYDFLTGQWEPVEQEGVEMECRAWHSVTVVGDTMLLFGDNGDCEQSKENPGSLYGFNFKTRTWTEFSTTGEPPAPDDVQDITEFNGKLYVLCLNYADSNNTMAMFCLDLSDRKWSMIRTKGQVPCGRIGCTATVLDGKWIVHGGFPRVFRQPQSWDIVGDTYEFDFSTHSWSVIIHPNASLLPRGGHVAVAWKDSLVFMGGTTTSGKPDHTVSYIGTGTYCTEVELMWKCPLPPNSTNRANRVHNLDMLKGISELYLDQETCDVVLKSQGTVIKAHKVILAASSKAFQRMFSVGMKETRLGEVDLDSVDPEVLEVMVKYMYGRLERIPSEMVVDLFRVADLYDMGELREECLMQVKEKITTENVAALVKAADEHSCPELLEACIEFASEPERLLKILSSDEYLNLLRQCPDLGQRFTLQTTSKAFHGSSNGSRNQKTVPELRNQRLDDLMRIM